MTQPLPIPVELLEPGLVRETHRNRLLARVRKNGAEGCWIWTGAKFHYGHGFINYRGPDRARKILTHRLMYAWDKGDPFPDVLDHLCGNTACCNPLHLQATTQRINTLRGEGPTAINAQRTHCKHGHPLYGDNLHIEKGTGKRRCRACMANRSKAWRERVDYGRGGAGTRKYRLASSGKKTECVNGHAWTPANITYRKSGRSECKVCHRERQLRRYHANMETK